jgi:hypothetical protein
MLYTSFYRILSRDFLLASGQKVVTTVSGEHAASIFRVDSMFHQKLITTHNTAMPQPRRLDLFAITKTSNLK